MAGTIDFTKQGENWNPDLQKQDNFWPLISEKVLPVCWLLLEILQYQSHSKLKANDTESITSFNSVHVEYSSVSEQTRHSALHVY